MLKGVMLVKSKEDYAVYDKDGFIKYRYKYSNIVDVIFGKYCLGLIVAFIFPAIGYGIGKLLNLESKQILGLVNLCFDISIYLLALVWIIKLFDLYMSKRTYSSDEIKQINKNLKIYKQSVEYQTNQGFVSSKNPENIQNTFIIEIKNMLTYLFNLIVVILLLIGIFYLIFIIFKFFLIYLINKTGFVTFLKSYN